MRDQNGYIHRLYRIKRVAPGVVLAWFGAIRKIVILCNRYYFGIEETDRYTAIVWGECRIAPRP